VLCCGLRRHKQFAEQLVRFDSLSFKLYEPTANAPAITQPVAAAAVLPKFQARTLTTIWDKCNFTGDASDSWDHTDITGAALDSGFLRSRLGVLKWIAAVGYDINDAPLVPTELITALAQGTDPGNSRGMCGALRAAVGHVRFYGALQSLFKLHPLFDRAVANILSDLNAVIIISRNGKQRVWEESYRYRLRRAIVDYVQSSSGLCTNTPQEERHRCTNYVTTQMLSRVVFVNQMKHAEYSALLCRMDITLDTFPFGGGVTLSDALLGCGDEVVPFVTTGSLQSVHQIGAGVAAKLGMHASAGAVTASAGGTSALTLSDVLSNLTQQWTVTATRYATLATQTTVPWHRRKLLASKPNEDQRRQQQREKIRYELFQSDESVQEWSLFLRSVVL
jgi:hypothetical protein